MLAFLVVVPSSSLVGSAEAIEDDDEDEDDWGKRWID
jgi:hypothetical protein